VWSDHTTRLWSDHTSTLVGVQTYEAVLQHIEDELAAGRLRLGERLPGERALAQRLNVGRSSVREALRVLEAMGAVRRAVGSGPDAGAVMVAEPSAGIGAALRVHLATSHLPMGDVVATRVLLESWALREAAGRGPEQFAEAARLLDAMADPDLAPEEFHRLDASFHIELTAVAGNAVISSIMSALRSAIHSYVMAAVAGIADWPTMADRLRQEHQAVFAALVAGDGELAASRVTQHITGFYRDAAVVARHDAH
jgi:GntR family transcriptional regulator, transcriptional repressor for pyruvate dehydrogenase complex